MEHAIWISDSAIFDDEDPAPFTVQNPESNLPFLLVADHASNRIPNRLGKLGLDDEALMRHIAYDQGTRALTESLAARLGCRAVLCNFSRLVVDCNRQLFDDTSIPQISDAVLIPGNQNLTTEQRHARVTGIFNAYHGAIDRALDDLQKVTVAPALMAIHSFTPRLVDGDHRPWNVGVLWDKDHRLAQPLLDLLRKDDNLYVGDNEPYSGRHPADYTVDTHGEGRGLPCASIEIRNDLLADGHGVREWSVRLTEILTTIQSEQDIFAECNMS